MTQKKQPDEQEFIDFLMDPNHVIGRTGSEVEDAYTGGDASASLRNLKKLKPFPWSSKWREEKLNLHYSPGLRPLFNHWNFRGTKVLFWRAQDTKILYQTPPEVSGIRLRFLDNGPGVTDPETRFMVECYEQGHWVWVRFSPNRIPGALMALCNHLVQTHITGKGERAQDAKILYQTPPEVPGVQLRLLDNGPGVTDPEARFMAERYERGDWVRLRPYGPKSITGSLLALCNHLVQTQGKGDPT